MFKKVAQLQKEKASGSAPPPHMMTRSSSLGDRNEVAELRSHISARQASPAASSSSFSTSIAIATPVVVVQPRTSTSSSAPQALTSQLQGNPPDQNEPLNRQDRKDEAQSSSESSAATTPNINPSSSPSAPNLYHEEEKRGDGVLAERPPSSGRRQQTAQPTPPKSPVSSGEELQQLKQTFLAATKVQSPLPAVYQSEVDKIRVTMGAEIDRLKETLAARLQERAAYAYDQKIWQQEFEKKNDLINDAKERQLRAETELAAARQELAAMKAQRNQKSIVQRMAKDA